MCVYCNTYDGGAYTDRECDLCIATQTMAVHMRIANVSRPDYSANSSSKSKAGASASSRSRVVMRGLAMWYVSD